MGFISSLFSFFQRHPTTYDFLDIIESSKPIDVQADKIRALANRVPEKTGHRLGFLNACFVEGERYYQAQRQQMPTDIHNAIFRALSKEDQDYFIFAAYNKFKPYIPDEKIDGDLSDGRYVQKDHFIDMSAERRLQFAKLFGLQDIIFSGLGGAEKLSMKVFIGRWLINNKRLDDKQLTALVKEAEQLGRLNALTNPGGDGVSFVDRYISFAGPLPMAHHGGGIELITTALSTPESALDFLKMPIKGGHALAFVLADDPQAILRISDRCNFTSAQRLEMMNIEIDDDRELTLALRCVSNDYDEDDDNGFWGEFLSKLDDQDLARFLRENLSVKQFVSEQYFINAFPQIHPKLLSQFLAEPKMIGQLVSERMAPAAQKLMSLPDRTLDIWIMRAECIQTTLQSMNAALEQQKPKTMQDVYNIAEEILPPYVEDEENMDRIGAWYAMNSR